MKFISCYLAWVATLYDELNLLVLQISLQAHKTCVKLKQNAKRTKFNSTCTILYRICIVLVQQAFTYIQSFVKVYKCIMIFLLWYFVKVVLFTCKSWTIDFIEFFLFTSKPKRLIFIVFFVHFKSWTIDFYCIFFVHFKA